MLRLLRIRIDFNRIQNPYTSLTLIIHNSTTLRAYVFFLYFWAYKSKIFQKQTRAKHFKQTYRRLDQDSFKILDPDEIYPQNCLEIQNTAICRCVVLGMGDGSMTTLTIADPEKEGIRDYLKSLPSRNPEGCTSARGGTMVHTYTSRRSGSSWIPCVFFWSEFL